MKIKNDLSYIVNITTADDLVTQAARKSATYALTHVFIFNIHPQMGFMSDFFFKTFWATFDSHFYLHFGIINFF